MTHDTAHMQPQRVEIECYTENVAQLPNADDSPSIQQFEWVQEERNFANATNSCRESCPTVHSMNGPTEVEMRRLTVVMYS
jgi:hypothetical protein